MDRALQALYDSDRRGGLGSSAPSVARWLGDIREYFPASIVQVLQRDALERLDLKRMLTEPEMLESVQPDVHLVADLIAMSGAIPAKTRDTARQVVQKVVDDLMRKLAEPTRQAIHGALNRGVRNRRPRHRDIDWPRTIKANLKNYQPGYQTIIPEVRIGYGRRRQSMRHIVLCIDQSGSMAASVVYAAIFAAVLATLPAVSTSLVFFDTTIVDLTDKLDDPIDVLFSTRLGGGTDINRAVAYCQQLVRAPSDTIFVLVSDLFEGGVEEELMKRAASLVASGVQLITLLALSDDGAPSFNAPLASQLAALGVPAFACTPDKFPDLMAAAIQHADLRDWVARKD
jgi:Mg-chelatase subunit ChlD